MSKEPKWITIDGLLALPAFRDINRHTVRAWIRTGKIVPMRHPCIRGEFVKPYALPRKRAINLALDTLKHHRHKGQQI